MRPQVKNAGDATREAEDARIARVGGPGAVLFADGRSGKGSMSLELRVSGLGWV